MTKKIIFCTFLFVKTMLFAMEEKENDQTKFIPPELKSRIMLYLVGAMKDANLDQVIGTIKKQFQASELKEIFDKDIHFTKNLIELLHRSFKSPINEKVHRMCLAAKLNTNAANNILRDEYKENPLLFISFIIELTNSFKSYCVKELLQFVKNNFKSKDIKALLLYKEKDLGMTTLMYAAKSGNSEVVRLFLNLAAQYLSPEQKKTLINNQTINGASALFWAYYAKSSGLTDPDWQASLTEIIDLLEKNGAEETDGVKDQKRSLNSLKEILKRSEMND